MNLLGQHFLGRAPLPIFDRLAAYMIGEWSQNRSLVKCALQTDQTYITAAAAACVSPLGNLVHVIEMRDFQWGPWNKYGVTSHLTVVCGVMERDNGDGGKDGVLPS